MAYTKKHYTAYPCPICGKLISSNGLAQYQHSEMHKRKGETRDNQPNK